MVIVVSLSGCFRTYTFKKERVDQEISGNRGVLLGETPPASRSTAPKERTVIGVDVEIPEIKLFGDKKKSAGKKTSRRKEPTTDKELWGNRGNFGSGRTTQETSAYPYSARGVEKESIVEKSRARKERIIPLKPKKKAKPRFITYKVKKGDTLSSIAARSDIYGDAGKWNRIYEANKDKIKKPSRVYPGQVLRIPLVEEKTKKRSRVK